MHARMEDDTLVTRDTPTGGAWEDGQWLDFTDPNTLSEWEARHGWVPVTETPRPDDTDTVKHDGAVVLVDGVPTQTWTARPWNTAEVAERDEQAAAAAKVIEDRAILDAIAHTSATAHVDGQAWTQPSGAHNAYPLGRTVTHNGKTWENLTPANVWQPGVSGWREKVASGPAAWVQPLGAHDAYPLGAKVTHKGKTWTSTAAANVWQPGVYGWNVHV